MKKGGRKGEREGGGDRDWEGKEGRKGMEVEVGRRRVIRHRPPHSPAETRVCPRRTIRNLPLVQNPVLLRRAGEKHNSCSIKTCFNVLL